MTRQKKLEAWEVAVGSVLIDELESLTQQLEHTNVPCEEYEKILNYMESIKLKMRKYIVTHKDWPVVEQYLKFDEIIKLVRELQYKNNVTPM